LRSNGSTSFGSGTSKGRVHGSTSFGFGTSKGRVHGSTSFGFGTSKGRVHGSTSFGFARRLVKGECLPFSCDYCDRELVHKIAQVLLPGLATACVDNTTGGLFKSPSSVAIDLRKEMVDYLTQRSETFIAESVVPQEGAQAQTEETSDDPVEIISEFLDNFSSSKRNFFSRVSNWLLSESREDKIDDFVQEMEMDEFWSIDRRETVSQVLLRNVDLKSAFHCVMKFGSEHELVAHKNACCFRPMDCPNEGCLAKFSAEHMEKHDSACPFKVLSCEQNCSQSLMRREMDRHCITVCPMRLINCPFNQAGCESTIPQCTLKEHCSQYLQSHILYVLRTIHKQGVSEEELKRKAELLEKSLSESQVSRALDVRSLTYAIKQQEAKMQKTEGEVGAIIS
ncbi:uncharacterized protein LOC109713779, partial [Ananas comosus]|uniref:Uncharacterized protein LOC109713779 n=1 Tax=Ananas comosus TaxID=4615 RepID=A0A6P5FC82_ANACO